MWVSGGIGSFAFTCLTLYFLSVTLGRKSPKFRGITSANDSRFATGHLELRDINIPKKALTGPVALFNERAPMIGLLGAPVPRRALQ